MGDHASTRHTSDDVGDGLVRHNDLVLDAAHAGPLIAAGFDSLDALFGLRNDLTLFKPGLEKWRERIRVEIESAEAEARSNIHARAQPSNSAALPRREESAAMEGTTVAYLKRFSRPPAGARRQVRRAKCAARSLAGLEWHWLRTFAAAGIPAATPLAFGEEFRRGKEIRSAVLIAAVAGKSLERWCGDDHWPDRATVRLLLPQLAQLIARMHAAGLVHRDLYLGHIFFNAASTDQTWGELPVSAHAGKFNSAEVQEQDLRLIDLQRVLRPAFFRSRWMVKDLAQLNYSVPGRISRADRLRFLHCYQQAKVNAAPGSISGNGLHNESRSTVRQLAYRIAGKSAQIAAHDQSRRMRHLAGADGADLHS